MPEMRSGHRLLIVCAFALLPRLTAGAQCADGSPPPCRAQPPAASRPASTTLDERTWIVVPFDNMAANAEVDWLRRASVSLMNRNLSQWKDVHAVDDERVNELLAEVPGSGGRGPIVLATATRVARLAGAGRLVMGEFLKTGSRTTITVRVIDVRTGARIRSASETALEADSILPAYGSLARKVLDLPAATASSAATLGTARLDAYQEYVAGTQAFRRYDLLASRRHFERALELDSAFALAHYKLAHAIMWYDGSDTARFRAHAAAALRLGSGLPLRERSLIRATAAEIRSRYADACDIYSEMLRTDSLDIDALFGLGHCSAADNTIEAARGDTTVLYFRSSWNTAIRAMKRVLELDPANHIAFDDIVYVLTTEIRYGCQKREGASECIPLSQRAAMVRRSGDSLVTVPAADTVLRDHAAEGGKANTRRANLELARQLAVAWTELAPADGRARVRLAIILLRMGRLGEAERQLTPAILASLRDPASVRQASRVRIEIALKQWRTSDAARLVDSASRSEDPVLRRTTAFGFGPAFGRMYTIDSSLTESDARLPLPSRGTRRQVPRIVLGVRSDSAVIAESRLLLSITVASLSLNVPLASFETFAFGLRLPRRQWPPFDDAKPEDARVSLIVALARGDSAAVRDNAARLDSVTAALVRAGIPDSGSAVVAADAHLILRDSLAAHASLRRFLDSTVQSTPFATPVTPPTGVGVIGLGASPVGWLWPRAMLLRAELADALGHKAEARSWYQRFVDLWMFAEPEFQPLVERARRALGTVSGG